MAGVLFSIQQEVADGLRADPFFANIPVLVEQPHDLDYGLQASVAAAGIYGVVMVPQAAVGSVTAPGPIFDPVEIAVRFRENVPVAPGPHALEAAETALALLHLYRPVSVNEVLSAAPQALVRVDEPGIVAYEIRLRTQAVAAYAVTQLAVPVITSAGTVSPQTVMLSTPTPGAAIFYTVDGSQPSPGSPTASLYTGPVTIGAPALLRVRAWLAGYLASGEARAIYA